MKDFRDLKVWEKAHNFTLKIYKITNSFPREEIYGLTSQIRRASYSIPTNIAEGCGRISDAEFARFLEIAFGSACEAEYQLVLTRDLGYIKNSDYDTCLKELAEIKKMLSSFVQKLRAER